MPGSCWKITDLLVVCLLAAVPVWGEAVSGEGYRLDPTLAGTGPSARTAEAATPLAIEGNAAEGEVRLTTNTPVAPYVEAVNGRAPTGDELRLLPEEQQRGPLDRYQLGAGVGIAVEDNASLSLGYRLHQPLSLLDDSRPAAAPRDDLRIFFDIKLPFD